MDSKLKALYQSNLTEQSRKERAIKEVAQAEEKATNYIKSIEDPTTRDTVDQLIGNLAAAYELQGFSLGYTVACLGGA